MNTARLSLLVALSLALAGSAVAARAAGFDCTKAASAVEKTICSEPTLNELDERLAESYAKASRRCPSGEVKAGQQRWLAEVRNRCRNAACLASAYRERLPVLLDWQCPPDETCAGPSAKLAGAWKLVSESGPFEEIAFSSSDGEGRFDTWLEGRPEIADGRWRLQGCHLRLIYPGGPGIGPAARMTVKKLDAERLEILDEGETAPAVYRRMNIR